MEKEYAQAIIRSLDSIGEKKTADGLFAHLKQTGRMRLLPMIHRELERALIRRELREPHVEAASEAEAAHAKKMAGAVGIKVKTVVVNDSLIHGWRARIGSSLVDVSGKKTLIDLYRTITH